MDAVEEIKSRLSIEDVVGRYVDLKRTGSTYKGLCPFHQEKTPSFIVSPSRGTFHCFGCGKGGDIFTFMMESERLPFPEALKELAEQASVRLPERQQNAPSLKNRLFEANDEAARFYRQALSSQTGSRAAHYLAGRHIDEQARALFELGYAPETRNALSQHLRKAGFEDRILLSAGLAMAGEQGEELRDRFHGRLMFPIRTAQGKASGFGGRTLDDSQPKYLNSPQTEIFDKSGVVYAIHLAAETIRKEGRAILVEGYLDAMRAHLSGYGSVVASLGTAVTVPQLTALSRLTGEVILALDPDPAGQTAAARTAITALAQLTQAKGRETGSEAALDLRIARLPAGEGDPDDLIRTNPQLWEKTIESAIPAFEFYYIQIMEGLDRAEDSWRQEAIDRLLPLVQQFAGSTGWQAQWTERLARDTGVDPRAFRGAVPAGRPAGRGTSPRLGSRQNQEVMSGTTARALTLDPGIGMEQSLLALLLTVVVAPPGAADQLIGYRMERPEHQTILNAVLAWAATGNYEYEMLRESLPEDVRELADELQKREVPMPDDNRIGMAVAYHLARRQHFALQSQLARISDALQDVEPEERQQGVAALNRLMIEKLEVEHSLDALSKTIVRGAERPESHVQGTIDHESGSS
ncbi:MAG: DNA primase [Chloroflexota bacterium]